MKKPMRPVDFRIRDEGSVIVFTPLTSAAREFVKDEVQLESWQWRGDSFVADHRPGHLLLDALCDEGFLIGVQR